MTNIMGETGKDGMVSFTRRKLTEELVSEYPALQADEESLSATLVRAAELTGNKFIMIMDEWDAPIRETPEIQKEYLVFLRSLFKSSGITDRIFAAVYMTGILPIKKDGSESAISGFREYTMLEPGEFQPYVGFTEEDVRKLGAEYHLSFEEAKRWYDGLFQVVLEMLGGFEIPVDTDGFNIDVRSIRNRDDLLTLLIPLGYLAYDGEEGTVRIPNEEIRIEFSKSVREVKSSEAVMRLRESRKLIQDTVQMNEEAVAAQVGNFPIAFLHILSAAPLVKNPDQCQKGHP